jgi:hypothetical protein
MKVFLVELGADWGLGLAIVAAEDEAQATKLANEHDEAVGFFTASEVRHEPKLSSDVDDPEVIEFFCYQE